MVIAGTSEDATTATVLLYLNGVQAGERQVSAPGTTTLRFSGLAFEPGDNRLRAQLVGGDDLAIDDARYHVVRNEPPAPIPLLTLNRDGLPVTYLSAALHSDPSGAYRVEPGVIGDFDTRTLSRYRWIIADDIGTIGADLETALTEFVAAGGGLLAFAGQRSVTAARIPVLGNGLAGASVGGSGSRFVSIGQVDTGHPLLADTQGWYAVNLSQTVPVRATTADEVLIRLENGEPFLMERRIGNGRVLLVAGGLENEWNDLPVRPVFVSFVIEAARYLSGVERLDQSFTAGESLLLSNSGSTSGQVVDPEGRSILSLADTTRAQRIPLRKTGFYEVYTTEGDYLVAVNTDPRESMLAPIAAETLRRWKDALSGGNDSRGAAMPQPEAQSVELWHALLFILVLVLIAESFLANVYLAPRTSSGSS